MIHTQDESYPVRLGKWGVRPAGWHGWAVTRDRHTVEKHPSKALAERRMRILLTEEAAQAERHRFVEQEC